MATEVVMPQMGESITEGTITKWFKQVGETVEKEENLFEISTDKVDAEIPSPVAGVLLEIRGGEGDTLEVGTVVAIVGEAGESGASTSSNGNSANNGNAAQTASAAATATTAATVGETNVAEAAGRSYDYETRAGAVEQAAEIPSPQSATQTASAPIINNGGARTDVVMPQMGESITEGTISKWFKQVGERVEKDENLFEISTDKVDAEIPSPVAGVLLEIRGQEGETLEVGAIVAVVGEEGASGAAVSPSNQAAQTQAVQTPAAPTNQTTSQSQIAVVAAPNQNQIGGVQGEISETSGRSYDYEGQAAILPTQIGNGGSSNGAATVEELRRTKSSPLVRKIAEEHKIDISRLSGTGASGRVTRDDIMGFIASGAALTPQQAMKTAQVGASLPPIQTQVAPQQFVQPQVQAAQTPVAKPAQIPVAGAQDRVEPMSVMRKKIAEHMIFSKETSAHVSTVYEIDLTNVVKFRDKNKNEFQARYGTKLTFMPFIFQAVTAALRKFPIVNAQVAGENIIYKGDINLGMAVALDWGLIVPVIKRADTLSLSGLALTANDLADRARTKKLLPDEVAGGTFTITNPGVFGGLYGTPIINQPQVAILCVGTIEKRAKVITSPEGDDYIAIRSMAYFCLTYDHRIVDGADAERFLAFVKETLESGQFAL